MWPKDILTPTIDATCGGPHLGADNGDGMGGPAQMLQLLSRQAPPVNDAPPGKRECGAGGHLVPRGLLAEDGAHKQDKYTSKCSNINLRSRAYGLTRNPQDCVNPVPRWCANPIG